MVDGHPGALGVAVATTSKSNGGGGAAAFCLYYTGGDEGGEESFYKSSYKGMEKAVARKQGQEHATILCHQMEELNVRVPIHRLWIVHHQASLEDDHHD